jgi:hypothetical protein
VSYALPPRPQPSPEETAAVLAAVEELLLSQQVVPVDTAPTWRFSGRWFNSGPYSMRRPVRST